MSIPALLSLKNSPPLREVVAALNQFVDTHGPADVYFDGTLIYSYDNTSYTFPGVVYVERILPQQGVICLPLLDGFYPWMVTPTESYQFEIVPKGTTPSRGHYVINSSELWPEWTADVLPYAQARKLDTVIAILKLLGFRNPVNAPLTGSIAPEFRSKRRRCGIYVLHFANGEYYVGQTVDITRRFVQHRARHADIVHVSFRPVGRRSLDFHEAQLIRLLETRSFRLRNIDMTSILPTEQSSFDELMDEVHQQRWLDDMTYVDLSGADADPIRIDQVYRERFEALKRLDCYHDVFPVVSAFIRNGIPAIKRGEACYWQASVLPSSYTVLARVNINWQEVFIANIDEEGPYFRLITSKQELQRRFGEDLVRMNKRYENLEWEDVLYRAGGSDQISVVLGDAATALQFLNDPDTLPAIRHFNLRLMKKGKCPWVRSHNFDLVDAVIAEEQPA